MKQDGFFNTFVGVFQHISARPSQARIFPSCDRSQRFSSDLIMISPTDSPPNKTALDFSSEIASGPSSFEQDDEDRTPSSVGSGAESIAASSSNGLASDHAPSRGMKRRYYEVVSEAPPLAGMAI